jgi:LemA protein
VNPGSRRRRISRGCRKSQYVSLFQFRWFAVAESYPDLKANLSFLELQKRITELQSQIADRREFYNDAINLFNTRIQEMPDSMLGGPMGLKPRSMFQVSAEEKAPANVALTPTQI